MTRPSPASDAPSCRLRNRSRRLITATTILLCARFATEGAASEPATLAGLHETTAGHYQVLTQCGPELGADVNRFMNEMLKQYSRLFVNWGHKEPARVVVFGRLDDFERYAHAETHRGGLQGYCLVKTDDQGRPFHELVTYQHDNLYRTLAHEGFHQFLAYELGDRAPIWLNEGLAQYFETAVVQGNRLVVGEINRPTLAAAQSLIAHRAAPAIAELIAMDQPTFYQHADRTYPTSWALVYFLRHRTADRFGDSDLRHYFTDLKLGQDPVRAFAARFGRNPRVLQAEFEQFVRRLHARFD